MRCVDTNVLVYAYRSDLPEHGDYRQMLELWANDDEPLGVPDLVLSGFVRIMTNRRVFREPTDSNEVWAAVQALREAPAVVALRPGDRHWVLFRQLAKDIDAYLPDEVVARTPLGRRQAIVKELGLVSGADRVGYDRAFHYWDKDRGQVVDENPYGDAIAEAKRLGTALFIDFTGYA